MAEKHNDTLLVDDYDSTGSDSDSSNSDSSDSNAIEERLILKKANKLIFCTLRKFFSLQAHSHTMW